MDSKLKIGDLLYRDKGLVSHAGVYLGGSQVLHIQPGKRVQVSSFAGYADGKSVGVIRGVSDDQSGITERRQHLLNTGEAYKLLSNNCEHVATHLLHGKRWSPQMRIAVVSAFAIGFLTFSDKNQRWLGTAIIGGILGLALHRASRNYDFVI